MKTLLAVAVGVIMLVSVGMNTISGGGQAQASINETNTTALIESSKGVGVESQDIKKLPEYETIMTNVETENYNPRVLEDNTNKRVILLKDDTGRKRYKSVYIKRENHLKIIDYRGGQIFNDYIQIHTDTSTQSSQETKTSISDTVAKLPEYKKLADTVDLSGYSAQIIEDNRGKRIILFKDANGQTKYKTIYVKYTGVVKIINL